MATEVKYPDGTISNSNWANYDVNTLDDTGTWIDPTSNLVDPEFRVSFPTPTGPPTTGDSEQTFSVIVRKFETTQTGTPTVRLEVWETGGSAAIAVGSEVNVTNTGTGQTVNLFWTYSGFTASDGSGVELRLVVTHVGGPSGQRASVSVDYVEWSVSYTTEIDLPTSLSATASSAWSADLTEDMPLVLTGTAVSSWSAELVEAIPISASLTAISSWSAELVETIPISASLTAISSWTADLTEQLIINANWTAQSRWQDINAGPGVYGGGYNFLSFYHDLWSYSSSSLTETPLDISLSGTGTSAWTADVTEDMPLVLTATGVSSWSADLTEVMDLTLSESAVSAWSAEVSTALELSTSLTASSSWTADVLEVVPVSLSETVVSAWTALTLSETIFNAPAGFGMAGFYGTWFYGTNEATESELPISFNATLSSSWSADLTEVMDLSLSGIASSVWMMINTDVVFNPPAYYGMLGYYSTWFYTDAPASEVFLDISSSLTGVSSWSADLTEVMDLTLSAVGVSAWYDMSVGVVANPVLGYRLGGYYTSWFYSGLAGEIDLPISLTGAGVSDWSADLVELLPIVLSGTAVSFWSSDSAIDLAITISEIGVSAWSADLTEVLPLTLGGTATSNWSADLTEILPLGISIVATSEWTAEVTEIIPITIAIQATSEWTSDTVLNLPLTISVSGVSNWTAEATVQVPLTLSVLCVSVWSADLLETIPLYLSAIALSSWTAQLVEQLPISLNETLQSYWRIRFVLLVTIDLVDYELASILLEDSVLTTIQLEDEKV